MRLKQFRRYKRQIASLFISMMIFHFLPVNKVYGLTSGPSQPEIQEFEQASTTQMVDLFTGDFTYNIPLFELPGPKGGYPFNLAYHAGISTEQEASWVGLGWSLNPGAITRQVRGVPDDFKGDIIKSEKTMKPNETLGIGGGVGGEIFGADKVSGSVGLSMFYNNYKGIGASIDGDVGFLRTNAGPMSANLGLGFSLNSQEGASLRPSLNLSFYDDQHYSRVSTQFGVGYHSRHGLTNMSYGISLLGNPGKMAFLRPEDNGRYGNTFGSSISLFNPGYTPYISMPMKSVNTSLKISAGAAAWGGYGKGYIRGFKNTQRFKYDGEEREIKSFGYMNSQHATEKDLMDFNREKEGMVREETPNLAIPNLMYDVYSVTGQGMGAMYRPIRNDLGIVHDPRSESVSESSSIGVEAAPVLAHAGVNLGLLHASSVAGKWNIDELNAGFEEELENEISEPWHFKVHGEHTSEDYLYYSQEGADDPIDISLDGTIGITPAGEEKSRKPRAQSIQAYTNEDILNSGNQSEINLLKIEYLNAAMTAEPFQRNDSHIRKNHIAGFIATKDDGMRYVYGLPVYNLEKKEVAFSTHENGTYSNSDIVPLTSTVNPNPVGFSSKTTTPAYAHSFLLTAVVGPDYVDIGDDGVDDKDLGYWVKFTYEKPSDDYRWRTPFAGANYEKGYLSNGNDNRGSYLYGKKQLWYLSSAETKTHIAKLKLSERLDNYGASTEDQNTNSIGVATKKVDELVLHAKQYDAQGNLNLTNPVVSVHLKYDYELCPQTPNSKQDTENPLKGKLTLKSVHFNYGNSNKTLGNYSFEYGNNFPYHYNANDRWGNYKSPDDNVRGDYPYVRQTTDKSLLDSYAAAWSMTSINLPSGGKITVDYEADDYACVQHKRAMQMMPLKDAQLVHGTSNQPYVKLRFTLDKNYGTELPGNAEDIVKEYLDFDKEQLYFKAMVNLKDNYWDFVSGYMDIANESVGIEPDSQGNYTIGFFHIKTSNEHHYNPISLLGWQHLRTNQPDLLNFLGNKEAQFVNPITMGRALIGAMTQIKELFGSFNSRANERGWSQMIDPSRSWIRLSNPNLKKYGGGIRVKKIEITEETGTEPEVYGQVYQYEKEESGRMISSGVAAYEPIIGAEENPLRKAKKYRQDIKLQSDNNLFFELPINESHYPGPQVGYGRVTVMSLASAAKAGIDPADHFPDGVDFGTTGKTVHEFYTAREFPVIAKESTIKKKKIAKISINPLLGVNSSSEFTATQGYHVITNDMHGKLKKVSHFSQLPGGGFPAEPETFTSHEYQSTPMVYDNESVFQLNNVFQKDTDKDYMVKLIGEQEQVPDQNKVIMGIEQEAILDRRIFQDNSAETGVNANLDVLFFVFFSIPIPTFWPNVSKNSSEFKSAVSNKSVFKSGVLTRTISMQDGAIVETSYKKWDKLTGRPLLVEVKEKYDDKPIYTYQIPAYTQYSQMGAAYTNQGFIFEIGHFAPVESKENEFEMSVMPKVEPYLVHGDELMVYSKNEATNELTAIGKAIYLGSNSGQHRVYSDHNSIEGVLRVARIYRSGRRNLLMVNAGEINALTDPTSSQGTQAFSGTLVKPIGN